MVAFFRPFVSRPHVLRNVRRRFVRLHASSEQLLHSCDGEYEIVSAPTESKSVATLLSSSPSADDTRLTGHGRNSKSPERRGLENLG